MGITESLPATIAPLLLRNLLTSILINADKSFLNLAQKSKLLEAFRYVFLTCFHFFLRFLPSFFDGLEPPIEPFNLEKYNTFTFKLPRKDNFVAASGGGGGDSGIARALSQLLSIVNDIPVSSRKYEVVRSLAERIIDENHRENILALREVNRTVLSSAFAKTLSQLEVAVVQLDIERGEDGGSGHGPGEYRLSWALKVIRSVRDAGWRGWRARREASRYGSGISAEKLAAELLWLAQRLAACGCGEEAVWRWAAASNLGWHAFWVEPRLQGSLVKLAGTLTTILDYFL